MFAYRVDRVVIFYQHASPYYTLMGQALEEQGVALEMHRYSELQLNMNYLSQFHDGQGGYSLLFFDDATSLVENNKKFNKKKFKELLVSVQDMKMEDQEHFLEYAFNNWKQQEVQTDDICVLGFKG